MNEQRWTVTFVISRQKDGHPRTFQSYQLEVDPDEYVLDGIERIWAVHDRSLSFRHVCHHSTCGVCGMVVNGVEKLTCITPIRSVTHDGGTIRVEPLHNFPVVSDLVVDMKDFNARMEEAKFPTVVPLSEAALPYEKDENLDPEYDRLVDCLECGLCISACPVASTASNYSGPAVLAAIHQGFTCSGDPGLLDLANSQDGLWRCHSAYECSEVCPSNVDPGWRIMNLRQKVVNGWIQKNIFRK